MKKQKKLPAFSAVIFAAAVIGFFAACDTGNGGGSSDGAFTDGGSGTPGVSGGTPGSGTSSSGPAVSTDSWGQTNGYDIASLTVDNSENFLYVTVEFANEISLWTNERIWVVIDDLDQTVNIDISKSGGAAAVGDWATVDKYGAASYVTPAVDHGYFLTVWIDGSSSAYNTYPWLENVTPALTADNGAIKFGSKTIEFVIPLKELNNPSSGTELKILAGVSGYWWESEAAVHIQVKNCIPQSAATVTQTAAENDTLSIDMSRALSYTVR